MKTLWEIFQVCLKSHKRFLFKKLTHLLKKNVHSTSTQFYLSIKKGRIAYKIWLNFRTGTSIYLNFFRKEKYNMYM